MEISEIPSIIEQNVITILFGFLVPIVGYYWNYRLKKRDIKNKKKELVLLFGKMIAEEPDVSNPELIYNVIKSMERESNIQRTLSRTNSVIEIFQDVQREFVQNQFIPKSERKKLLDKAKQIIDDIKNYEKIEVEPLSTFPSSISFLSVIITTIMALLLIYVLGNTLSGVTNIEFPFSFASIIVVFIGAIMGSAIVYVYVSGMVSSDVEEEKKYAGPILEDLTYSALISYFGEDRVKKNVRVNDINYDFLIRLDGKQILIEVKLGNILHREVKQFVINKSKITDGIGVILTNSEATDNAKKLAKKSDVIIFEKITNEEDIISNLKYTFKEEK